MSSVINDVAGLIREVDGANRMTATGLGAVLAERLVVFYGAAELNVSDVVEFVVRTNPDKQLGAGVLAELIVAEFGLDAEVVR
ncbi:hypothetical protein [Actinoplanes rectilineatus]|uniref:hypothetical protein n=1 Tax=Actinoplanes rectilineatus TaxID=113571 RepID=UPI0005F2AA6C|nr:hypothetical protein [Actinoplanes rectilineatus]